MGKMKAPKTGSGVREVQLLQPAIDALKAQRAHTATVGEFVFHDPRTNARWGSDQTIRAGEWQRVLRKAGVRYRTRIRCATPSPPRRSAPARTSCGWQGRWATATGRSPPRSTAAGSHQWFRLLVLRLPKYGWPPLQQPTQCERSSIRRHSSDLVYAEAINL